MVEVLHHALEAAALAKFDFKAHHEIESKEQVVCALHGEHLLGGFTEQRDFRLDGDPDEQTACQNGRTDWNFLAKRHDDKEHRKGKNDKDIHVQKSLEGHQKATVKSIVRLAGRFPY